MLLLNMLNWTIFSYRPDGPHSPNNIAQASVKTFPSMAGRWTIFAHRKRHFHHVVPHWRLSSMAALHDPHVWVAPVVGPDDPRRFTDSGIEVSRCLWRRDVAPGLSERLESRASFRSRAVPHREMYRERLWTMRQYAGYATAKESNERYTLSAGNGGTGLSMAFDLPTQLGLDSDDPRCLGEVGRTGVAIDTIDDMRMAFDQIPLDQVSTSMTINAPAGGAAGAV